MENRSVAGFAADADNDADADVDVDVDVDAKEEEEEEEEEVFLGPFGVDVSGVRLQLTK